MYTRLLFKIIPFSLVVFFNACRVELIYNNPQDPKSPIYLNEINLQNLSSFSDIIIKINIKPENEKRISIERNIITNSISIQDAHFFFNLPDYEEDETISSDYIGVTQHPKFAQNPDYLNESKRSDFLTRNKIRVLRDYQLEAVHSVRKSVQGGKDRFLLEMATGTGKTLISCAIIKMFLRLYKVNRVLFLVDRLELETQAQKEFDEVLKNDFRTVIWKENKDDWKKAEKIVKINL